MIARLLSALAGILLVSAVVAGAPAANADTVATCGDQLTQLRSDVLVVGSRSTQSRDPRMIMGVRVDDDNVPSRGLRQIGHQLDLDPGVRQMRMCRLGRGAGESRFLERAGELDDPFAVRDGEQGAQAGPRVECLAARRAAAAPASVSRV